LREELRPQILTWNGISWDFTLAVGEATGRAV
jgi:putative lin0820-like protein